MTRKTRGVRWMAVTAMLALAPAPSFAGPAAAVRTKEEAVRELLTITGASNLGVQMMDQMMPAMKQAMPGVPESFWTKFRASVKPDEMTDLMVPIYAKAFSLDELEQVIAFNKTPVGKKVIATMPGLMAECMAVGQEWGRKLGERAAREAAQK